MKKVAILSLWIVQISGLIGIGLGYDAFFLPKTPWTLLLIGGIMAAHYPVKTTKDVVYCIFVAILAIGAEWVGVHTGLLFGDYVYGDHLGPQVDGIPLLIGLNWVGLTLATRAIMMSLMKRPIFIVFGAAALMVAMDVLLEQICSYADFWHFEGGQAGWYNYVCWFALAACFHLGAQMIRIDGDQQLSWHVYASQFIFTAGLWLIIRTI